MGGVPLLVRFEGPPARGCITERRGAVTSGQQIRGMALWRFRAVSRGRSSAAVAERNRRIVAVHRDCERAGPFGGPAGSATGVSGHDVGDIRRPRCGRVQASPIQQRGKRGRRESARPARAYCSRAMPSAWVVSWVAVRGS
jgi:hypothetical protein